MNMGSQHVEALDTEDRDVLGCARAKIFLFESSVTH
jgi:hypothetical protein